MMVFLVMNLELTHIIQFNSLMNVFSILLRRKFSDSVMAGVPRIASVRVMKSVAPKKYQGPRSRGGWGGL